MHLLEVRTNAGPVFRSLMAFGMRSNGPSRSAASRCEMRMPRVLSTQLNSYALTERLRLHPGSARDFLDALGWVAKLQRFHRSTG